MQTNKQIAVGCWLCINERWAGEICTIY